MAATETIRIPLGYTAPDFTLFDTVSDKFLSLQSLKGEKATVIMFICNHCPYVKHVNKQLVSLANDYISKGISFIAISSNDIVNYPQDAPELMKITANEEGYPFPYLYDESQEVAKAYHAACTPDFSVFDANLSCVYRGQLDNSRPKNDSFSDGHDIRAALDNILAGIAVSEIQVPSLGCNIKWK
ncbi:MAG TPA: thioredoxin family protein [Chitinophagales bacterium]|nr:thioredoxin family protein [Chitinophagales bacterium]HMY23504.1 thioredoxin family protein [Chitinophagales bacterium]HNA39147.1 thioredoxin family protein [Chitinophagales bacterium]HNB48900.1 thioredoxin family protein [Chitinophagales bacterium]HND83110.1 thioredoxin family protein [Chitinophagales bacterium]